MTDYLVKVREGLKQAVENGKLRRSDLLDDESPALTQILGGDSLDRVELIMATAEKYSVSLKTVGELLDILEHDANSNVRRSK